MLPSINEYTYKTSPTPNAQKILQKRGPKDYLIQRIRKFAVRLCLLVISEVIPIKYHQYDCINMTLTKTTTKGYRQRRNAKGVRNSLYKR